MEPRKIKWKVCVCHHTASICQSVSSLFSACCTKFSLLSNSFSYWQHFVASNNRATVGGTSNYLFRYIILLVILDNVGMFDYEGFLLFKKYWNNIFQETFLSQCWTRLQIVWLLSGGGPLAYQLNGFTEVQISTVLVCDCDGVLRAIKQNMFDGWAKARETRASIQKAMSQHSACHDEQLTLHHHNWAGGHQVIRLTLENFCDWTVCWLNTKFKMAYSYDPTAALKCKQIFCDENCTSTDQNLGGNPFSAYPWGLT